MNFTIFKSITLLVFISFFSSGVGAAGLQNYLQGSESTEVVSQTSPSSTTTEISPVASSGIPSEQFTRVIELVVAGIVASALILSLLVLFLGRWVGNREKKKIKEIRIKVEEEQEHVTAAASTIKIQEKESTQLAKQMRSEAEELSDKKGKIEKYENDIIETSEQVFIKSQKIDQVTERVSDRFEDIQNYWEKQLGDTVTTIKGLQGNLDDGFKKVDDDIATMKHQKLLSKELLQDFLNRHNEQGIIIEKNTKTSEEVSKNLDKTLKESKQLIKLLKQHQIKAEKSLQNFNSELTVYEEQAYEQFDSSFQVADLARQELSANVDESRKHIEMMRRHEEKSHSINAQTQKNLESLDFSKIVKLSNTIDSAQDMFTDMRNKVEETKLMLDELKDIETDTRETASRIEISSKKTDKNSNSENLLEQENFAENLDAEYKMVSGDNAPISFFKKIKKK